MGALGRGYISTFFEIASDPADGGLISLASLKSLSANGGGV